MLPMIEVRKLSSTGKIIKLLPQMCLGCEMAGYSVLLGTWAKRYEGRKWSVFLTLSDKRE